MNRDLTFTRLPPSLSKASRFCAKNGPHVSRVSCHSCIHFWEKSRVSRVRQTTRQKRRYREHPFTDASIYLRMRVSICGHVNYLKSRDRWVPLDNPPPFLSFFRFHVRPFVPELRPFDLTAAVERAHRGSGGSHATLPRVNPQIILPLPLKLNRRISIPTRRISNGRSAPRGRKTRHVHGTW